MSSPRVDEKRDRRLRVTLGPWAPSVLSGESEDAGQSGVGGLLLGTRRGCLDPWIGIWAVDLPVSLYATAGTRAWRGPWLQA